MFLQKILYHFNYKNIIQLVKNMDFLKKQIRYNSSEQKTIRITIGKKDHFQTSKDFLYIVSSEQLDELQDEHQDEIMKLQKHKSDRIYELEKKILQLEKNLEYEKKEYNKIKTSYNNLNQKIDDYHNKIDSYQNKIDDYQENTKEYYQYIVSYANLYNSLRNKIKSFGLLDVFKRKNKTLLDEYQEIKIIAEPPAEIIQEKKS